MLMSIKNLTAALGLALALSTSAVYAETLQKQEQGQSVAPGIYRYTAVPANATIVDDPKLIDLVQKTLESKHVSGKVTELYKYETSQSHKSKLIAKLTDGKNSVVDLSPALTKVLEARRKSL